jgi:hypothetical protein
MAANHMNVHVRQEHIDLAETTWDGVSFFKCPLSLALLEKEHTEWVVNADYCHPRLKPEEQWGHSPESMLLLDTYDNGGEVGPQTVKLMRLNQRKKKTT